MYSFSLLIITDCWKIHLIFYWNVSYFNNPSIPYKILATQICWYQNFYIKILCIYRYDLKIIKVKDFNIYGNSDQQFPRNNYSFSMIKRVI